MTLLSFLQIHSENKKKSKIFFLPNGESYREVEGTRGVLFFCLFVFFKVSRTKQYRVGKKI